MLFVSFFTPTHPCPVKKGKGKCKGFPYSLPSVGPGADPSQPASADWPQFLLANEFDSVNKKLHILTGSQFGKFATFYY